MWSPGVQGRTRGETDRTSILRRGLADEAYIEVNRSSPRSSNSSEAFDDYRKLLFKGDLGHIRPRREVQDLEGAASHGHHWEKGGGEDHHSDHHHKHGKKADKGYKSSHHHGHGKKGHHDKEGKEGHYSEHGGHKKKHHDEGGYHKVSNNALCSEKKIRYIKKNKNFYILYRQWLPYVIKKSNKEV